MVAVVAGSSALAYLLWRFDQNSRPTRVAERVLALATATLVLDFLV
jgi:hypothetical protein